MKSTTTARPRKSVPFPYYSFRNISCPEDLENGRKVFSGQAPVRSVLELTADENVRDYLVEAEGKLRRRPTAVHNAIRETLLNSPDNFSILNSGVVIVARAFEVNEKDKLLNLYKPSIINGAQTQGVLKDIDNEGRLPDVHVKFEIIVTEDEDLIGETSIARNFQNDVMTISIVGRLGQLDELEESLKTKLPNLKLKKSETELSKDYVESEKLIQVITALIPKELWVKPGEPDDPNKVYTYSMKSKCLKDFQEIYKKAHDQTDPGHKKFKETYQFFLDIVDQAYELYYKWKVHQGFQGTGLRALERDGREIVDIPDGIVFPIIASLSAFAKKTKSGWRIVPPKVFRDDELIRAAKSAYQQIARSNPQTMGKNRACYSALYQITSIYKRLSE